MTSWEKKNKPERETLEKWWVCACLPYLEFSGRTEKGSNFASTVVEFPYFLL